MPPPTLPSISGVLETVLYFDDEEATLAFYGDLLGLRLLDREPGRSLFFRAGESVFLLFRPEAARRGGTLPPHGATGSIHSCFRCPASEYDSWKVRLAGGGVEILHETRWSRGRSFYFHDPGGNLLEIADADIWPR